jgi:hypothetical protein
MKYTLGLKEKTGFKKWASVNYSYAQEELENQSISTINYEYPKLVKAYSMHCVKVFIAEDLKFDMWTCFNYQGHNAVDYSWRRHNAGLKPSVNYRLDNNIKGNLEDGLKDLKNYFNRIARATHQHILLWIGAEYQPKGMLPHYHVGLKFEKSVPSDSAIVDRWREYNISTKDNSSAWIEQYNTDSNGVIYQEKCIENEIWIACPKRSRRCKKGECKGIDIFNVG